MFALHCLPTTPALAALGGTPMLNTAGVANSVKIKAAGNAMSFLCVAAIMLIAAVATTPIK
jgi:hypothetical protein